MISNKVSDPPMISSASMSASQSAPSWGAREEVRSRTLRALLRAVAGAARIRIPVCGQLGRGPGMVPEG